MYFIWNTVSFVEEEHCRVSIRTYLEGSDQMHFGLAESFRDGVRLWLCIHGKLKRMYLLRSLNFTVPVVVTPVCLDLCVVRQGEAGGCRGVAGPCRGAVSLAAACSPLGWHNTHPAINILSQGGAAKLYHHVFSIRCLLCLGWWERILDGEVWIRFWNILEIME